MRPRRPETSTPKRRRIRKLRLLALLLALLMLCSVAFAFGLVMAVVREVPQLDPAARRAHDLDSVILARQGSGTRVLAILRGEESRVIVSADEISPIMKQAIVAIEDKRFYEHHGVDLNGIVRALWEDIRKGSVVQGGSTITQQFVKNAYVRNERSIARKVREAAFAWQLEHRWSKERILTAYLNTIYFGNGAYGIQQAARTYFGVGARRLDLAQSALLAGLPRDPSLYDPARHPTAAKTRRRYVLEQMLQQGKVTRRQVEAAAAQPLPRTEEIRLPGQVGPAQHFVNYVKDQLVWRYGADRVFGGGLEVTTTIDLNLQELARKAIEKVLPDPDGPAAALVAIDPRTGAVKVMFGGTNFRRSQFNLASQAERQPGSSFKPIVLATAFREGISPAATFASKPVEIIAGDRTWKVTNYESSYLGTADLRRAMITSDNAVYAQLTSVVGPRQIVQTAHALGIRSELPAFFSIGLGAVAVNPLDMTRAYATIANDGRRVDGSITGNRPRVIDTVRFRRNGKTSRNEPQPVGVLSPDKARQLTAILEDVVEKGTGRRARLARGPAAGKTGTTDDYGDAWFVGYTPELVTAVWVGYPNALKPMLTEFGGEPVTGSTLPALIWKEFMSAVQRRSPAEAGSFPAATSPGYVERRVVFRAGWKLDNGYCTGTRLLAYFPGEGPNRTAGCFPNEVQVPDVTGLSSAIAAEMMAGAKLVTAAVFVPAPTGKRPGVVAGQEPRGGRHAAAGGTVRLFVTKARYGLVPNLVGSSARDARARIAEQHLRLAVRYAEGRRGTVLRQTPEPGVAAGRNMRITVIVGRS